MGRKTHLNRRPTQDASQSHNPMLTAVVVGRFQFFLYCCLYRTVWPHSWTHKNRPRERFRGKKIDPDINTDLWYTPATPTWLLYPRVLMGDWVGGLQAEPR